MRRFLRIVIISSVFVALICLPVIPVSTAPVVPNPIYSLRMVTLLRILISPLVVGISYQWHWYTFAAILVLLVVGCLVGAFVFRRVGTSYRN